MENTPKKVTGRRCAKCGNNIAVGSNEYGDGKTHNHLHCIAPSKRKAQGKKFFDALKQVGS